MRNVIEVKRVSKYFGRQQAVANVSLSVPAGAVFALLGENGAGKTTLLRMLLGLVLPTEGTLHVLGLNSATQGEAIRRQVGYVPERPTLYEWMTAAEIGWFTGGFYGDGFETNYRILLGQFGVDPHKRIAHMSKGTRSKIVLSLAMAHRPDLLVLDEPTSGLDTLVRREYMESMVDVAAEGRTVLLSSHQISEVERVADWVAIIHRGTLLDVSPLDELKRTTREWTITMEGAAAAPPSVDGTLLSRQRDGRQWRLLVRDDVANEAQRAQQIAERSGVVAVDVRTPSLEEIYVAYMQFDSQPHQGPAEQPLEPSHV